MMFRFLTKHLDHKTMIQLYYSFIYPRLIYGIEFWGHAADSHLKKIFTSQKKALRIINKQPPNSHISHKFEEEKIMPIFMLFKFRLIIYYHKHYYHESNLEARTYQTRNCFKPRIPMVKTEKGKRSMLITASKLFSEYGWEFRQLPADGFKRALAAHLWAAGGVPDKWPPLFRT